MSPRERRRSGVLCSFLLFSLGLSGCFAVFPNDTLRDCDIDISLRQLKLHPETDKGRMITVVGEILGIRSQALGEIDYGYPLISMDKLVLWDKTGTCPRIRIRMSVMGTV